MSKKEELSAIVGGQYVIDDVNYLDLFSRDESFTRHNRPAFVVQPHNTDEVQQLVKWANNTLTPLVPVSSGAPHFRGDSVPGADGAVIVDMSDMKKILRIDRKNRVAMIEPGVTFSELCPELKKAGLRPNMPLLPRRLKSVVGSVLEREPVIMPKYHWDIIDPLACTEVIFGSGDLYRTGTAAGPGTIEEQWESRGAQKSHAEPLADWCRIIQGAQGTMGIVTWSTIRCERVPKIEEPFMVGASSLTNLFEFIHWLVRLRLVDECLILNNVNLAHILTRQRQNEHTNLYYSLPQWVLLFCISGYEYYPEERISYQVKQMMDVAGRTKVEPVKELNGVAAKELLEIIQNHSAEPFWKTQSKGSCYDIFCLATYDRIPELVDIVKNTADENGYEKADIGIYLQPIVQGTSYHCEFNLFFNPVNPEEVSRFHNLPEQAIGSLIHNGAFFSRPYDMWVDLIYEQDAQTKAALKKLKNITDPNNIMNPGKLCFQSTNPGVK